MAKPDCLPKYELPVLRDANISADLSYTMISGLNSSAGFAKCCHPSPVKLALGCYEWCEYPQKYYPKEKTEDMMKDVDLLFAQCLANQTHGGNVTRQVHFAGADQRPSVGCKILFYWLLFLVMWVSL
ncbi:hypothetical protein CDD81_197 [Ophiocordyceps australis]|uniref:Uncharacterized protein n=1 Tax=Ophiocordyceps australis TaxID=1399860 RepID=A0A2C5YGM2_9HYPO|nr:hypothetical protein CDD81_197 [Ophiocordyceps australis]